MGLGAFRYIMAVANKSPESIKIGVGFMIVVPLASFSSPMAVRS